jgi:iron complex outermembrane receptor protein
MTRTRTRPRLARPVARLLLLALCGAIAVPAPGLAQGQPPNLSQVSIEDLMNIEVTSASRKEQRTEDVTAAVFVITHDDIRRSGMTAVPDVLRLAPGVEVAQINASKWAVSVRGFNSVYADKLLVLIDGRTIYDRIFSGVIWDAQDLPLEDVDRIEVIRGPGAALWGANAVNAVINIITRTAAETQGTLVQVEGRRTGAQAVVRYGGLLGTAAAYRVYAQFSGRDQPDFDSGAGGAVTDGATSFTTGVRADWTTKPNALTVESAFTEGRTHALWSNLDPRTVATAPIDAAATEASGGYVLGRWRHTRDNGASLQVQSFVDVASRKEPVATYDRETFDVDTQYHTTLGSHQDLVAGAGYRFISDQYVGAVGFSLLPAADKSSLLNAFLQDEISLFADRLALTLGSQVQHDSETGAGVQPTARVMWKGLAHQRLWTAASRALRTPSRYERGIQVDYPPMPGPNGLPLLVRFSGNPSAATEHLVDVEAGYRFEQGTSWSVDITGFGGRYAHLRTQETDAPIFQPGSPPSILVNTQFGNLLDATTRGVEIAGHWAPVPVWRLDGSYTAFHLTPHLADTSQDPAADGEDGSVPRTQWQLRSAFSPDPRATLSLALFHVGPLAQLHVDAYTRADVTAEWQFSRHLSAMVIGQNLLDGSHLEFAGTNILLAATTVPRSASVRLRWTF